MTPALHLETLYVLDERRRIVHTREPGAVHGPLFAFVRGVSTCAWAVRDDVPDEIARALAAAAPSGAPAPVSRDTPTFAARARVLLVDAASAHAQHVEVAGPAYAFPDPLPAGDGVRIDDEARLAPAFRGWSPGEIAAGRAPLLAIVEDGVPGSICFCARRSAVAAEAGVETVEHARGRGLAPRVVAAWAAAVRAEGLVPLYSTSWENPASLAVARKLGLTMYASTWSVLDA